MSETLQQRLDRIRRANARTAAATTVQGKIDAERQRRAEREQANR